MMALRSMKPEGGAVEGQERTFLEWHESHAFFLVMTTCAALCCYYWVKD
jgi:hypothetical protein